MNTELSYPNVGRQSIFGKGHYLVCNFSYHYLACKPVDKPEDPFLKLPLINLRVSAIYGEQFLQNLHEWKNEDKIISHLYCYLKGDGVYAINNDERALIPYIAKELEAGNLLIFPLDEPRSVYSSPTSYELGQSAKQKAASSYTPIFDAQALNDEVAKATPKPRANTAQSAAQILASKNQSNKSNNGAIKPPAQSINEAETRLIAAKQAIVTAQQQGKTLPQSTYTLADKQAVIENGLEENILVRVIETPHAGDDGTIGQVKGGRSITWTAPMSQVEHADSDAALLLNAFGTRHDASKSYTLLLIDRNKVAKEGDVTSIIPTFDNLNTMIANTPEIGISPELSKQVMNADFAPKYEAFANQGWEAGIDMNDPDKRVDFAINLGYEPETADLLSERHDIAIKISAWEIFTGNGMTRDTNVTDKVAYGPVEVFSYDKNPQQLGKLEKSGALKRIALD